MNRCPDKETLECLLEGELVDDTMNEVLGHLSECTDCLRTLLDFISGEAEIGRFFKILKTARSQRYLTGRKDCPSSLLLLAYITHSLSPERQSAVELHLEQCDKCVARLQKIQSYHMAPGELDLDLTFLDTETEKSEIPGS